MAAQREKSLRGHILTKKSAKRKRKLRTATTVSTPDSKRMKRLVLAE
jgi:LSU ribosomal protein L35P